MRPDTPLRGILGGALTLAACALFALFLNWAPTGLNGYQLRILNLIAINGILGLSLNLIYGMTGMFSLGHAGFMAIGAYVSALLILSPAQKEAMWILEPIAPWLLNLQAPFLVSLLAAGLIAAFFGWLIALPVLRAARSAGARAAHLQQSFARLEQLQAESQRKGSQPNVLIASVVEVGLLLVMAAGVSWAVQGSLNVAVLAAVAVMLARFAEPLSSFISFTSTLDLMETALERIEALLAVPPLPQLSPGQTPLRFDIAFEGIDFAYASGGPKVLSGFCATLPAHSMTAFVGPSGGGKTTVTRLLMRHADAQAGSVRIGGVDVRHIAPETLNRLISVVFQDVYLFDDTVLANIRMARPEATDEEVRQAARAAQCLDFIERLPQGWHTRIGEAGGRLSGGERQRISIARALLKNAPIVVLDEPTAALDTESECAVQRAIETLVQERTVIVIAHRLSTIVAARQPPGVRRGRALEAGAHEELLQKNGRYAALWRAQQQAKQWRA